MKDKLFYSIGEISRLTGVPAYTLRYWEKEFKLLRPETDSRGGRRYRRKDLDLRYVSVEKLEEELNSLKF